MPTVSPVGYSEGIGSVWLSPYGRRRMFRPSGFSGQVRRSPEDEGGLRRRRPLLQFFEPVHDDADPAGEFGRGFACCCPRRFYHEKSLAVRAYIPIADYRRIGERGIGSMKQK
jgi:hypothetical protein